MQTSGFCGPTYTLSAAGVACQRTINLIPEQAELGTAKNKELIHLPHTPGLRLACTLGVGPNRGLYKASTGQVYAVSGDELHDVSDTAAPAIRGHLQTKTGPCAMADNGVHLVVVDGQFGYVLTLADNTFHAIADPDFPAASHVAFIDQYIIVNEVGTRRFHFSALSDATDWDGLDFDSKEGAPDLLLALLVDHREIFLFGAQSSERWFDSGDPFARNPNGFMEHGTASPYAPKKLDNTVYWPVQDVNGNAMVVRLGDSAPQRISNHAIEWSLKQAGDISQATAWTYQSGGHSFYCLNLASTTLCFDAATQMWHERQSGGKRHRAENHVFTGTQHLVGDYENGNLYEMRDDEYTDNGAPIVRNRRWTHIANGGKRVFIPELFVDLAIGDHDALLNDDDTERAPQAMLKFSRDGGYSWGNEHWVSIGQVGNRTGRAIWRRMGESRNWVFDLTISDPVPVTLISAFPDVQAGAQ